MKSGQPKDSGRGLQGRAGWAKKHTPPRQQVAMEIGDESSDVAQGETLDPTLVALQELGVEPDSLTPIDLIAEVDAEVFRPRGHPDVRVGEQEFSDRRVQGEAMDAVARGVH